MKDTLKVGDTFEYKVAVDEVRTIAFMGEDLAVYATPSMVLDFEQACRGALLPHHDAGEDSVGARVEVDHLGATLKGQTVTISGRITAIDGRRVSFEADMHDGIDKVGQGRHIRFVIDKARQAERLAKKKAQL